MNPLIEFCMSNLANGAYPAFEELERDPELDVLEYGCLSYCTRCSDTLFALVNGEPVNGETPEELVKNIYKHLEENPMF